MENIYCNNTFWDNILNNLELIFKFITTTYLFINFFYLFTDHFFCRRKFLFAILALVVLYCEWLDLFMTARLWPTFTDSHQSSLNILIVSDPQILSAVREPIFPLGALTIWDSDRWEDIARNQQMVTIYNINDLYIISFFQYKNFCPYI